MYALPPGGSFAGGKTATTTTNASSAAAGGGSCPADGSPSLESNQSSEAYRCGSTTDNRRTGHAAWNDGGVSRTICKLAFEISDIEGDVSGKTFNAYIFTMTSGNLNVLQATSDNLTGVSATGWLVFNFSTPFATGGASTPYALVFGQAVADAVNYVWVVAGDTDVITGYRDLFDNSGNAQIGSGSAVDASVRIYWQ